MKRCFRILLICAVIIAAHPFWLPIPAKFLMVRDVLKKADAVVVLSGDWNFDREKKAIELYEAGFADKLIRMLEKENILFSMMAKLLDLDVDQKEVYRRFFESSGVGEGAVILGEEIATSTFDELKAARDIILKGKIKSFILVTSDYHMRRALMTAKRLFKPTGVTVYNAAVYSKGFDPNKWWLHERSIKEVVLEYLSIGFYVTYHFLLGR